MVTTRRGLDTAALSFAPLVATATAESTSRPVEREVPDDDDDKESPPEKNFRDLIIGEIWVQIDESITENGGSSYGIVSAKLLQHQKKFKWLNRDLLYNYRKQATKELQLPPHEITLQSASATQAVSELSFNAEIQPQQEEALEETDEAPEENMTQLPDEASTALTTLDQGSRNFGGRPKGTTNEAIRHFNFKKKLALNWAAVQFEKAKGEGRSKWGIYDSIVQEANKQFNLPPKYMVTKETVRSRLKPQRKLMVANTGVVSPMVRMEGYFVDIFLTLGAMRQPSNATEGLQIINSMIKGTVTETEVLEWKKKHLKLECNDCENGPLLGPKYWANFLRRHPQLSTKHCVRFDSQREAWATYENFAQMYDDVYRGMVKSGIAIELEEEVWVNKEGKIVSTEEESFGRKTKHILTRPNYLIFVDETGDDTSQKQDGNQGGEKFVVGVKERALLSSSFDGCHWTSLGFTLGDGRPLLCVIIIACSEVDAKTRMGLQPWCELQGNLVDNLQENSHGPNKYFPYGPSCVIDGKEIPC